jgi:preprotein translocase subunit SecY
MVVLTLLTIIGVVLVNEGTRNILLEYGVVVRSVTESYKLSSGENKSSGSVPIIFAVSVVSIPGMVGGPLMASGKSALVGIGTFLTTHFQTTSLFYNALYFFLVVAFTFFYTFIEFNPDKIADDVKKRGGFIPGIRPGTSTSQYLKKIVSRITLVGSLFLGLIAILPYFMNLIFGPNAISIGGTSLLISVFSGI